jgi:hypothetical protein
MLWYADNSELKGLRPAEIPDMLLFGGIIVPAASEAKFRANVEAVKANYYDARAPIKWNFKDLKRTYEAHGISQHYEPMLEKSKEWRREVFEVLAASDCTIIVSVVQSHSIKKDVIKDVRPDLVRYAFSNCLMRVGLHAQEKKPIRCQAILDWPENGDSTPFDQEYASAYREGRTPDRAVTYRSGALRDLAFADSVGYANMRHTTLLQVADLVVGATREFLECALKKREASLGLALCKLVAPRFRGYERGRVFGYGITGAGEDGFRAQLREFVDSNLALAARQVGQSQSQQLARLDRGKP